MNVMLLAAGEGTRLRPFTNTWPKPAIPFLNLPLAAHALSFLGDLKVNKLVVNTFHLPEKIHGLFEGLQYSVKSLHFSDEVDEILGSAGGLGKARDHFIGGGDFLMMNADEVILAEDEQVLDKALAQHKNKKSLATLLVKDHPGVGTQFGGVWTDANGQVLGFGKNPVPGAVKAWHFVGVQILSDKVFDFIPSFGASNILYDSLTLAMEKGFEVHTYNFECQWFETGNVHDFVAATAECFEILKEQGPAYAKKTLSARLKKNNVAFEIKKRDFAETLIIETARVDDKASLSGFITVGADSFVPASCELHNVIVGPQMQVPEGTKAHNTLII